MTHDWGQVPTRRSSATTRRRLLALAAGAVAATAAPAAVFAASPPPGRTRFAVLRGGSTIGSHVVDIADRGDRREVRSTIDIAATLLGVTVYAFRQRTMELWSPTGLILFESETIEDDASFWVKGRALSDGFEVETRKERIRVPAGTMIATYWRPEICRQPRLIEPKRGRLREQTLLATRQLNLTVAGGEVPAEEFRIRGILDGACTYDESGRWLAAWFDKKGRVDYRVTM
ncbi:MAG: DUF6134 family protein [Rhodospirillales bacterium]|nr:DUF6134 family protein [Rhodospirillales bacterium]